MTDFIEYSELYHYGVKGMHWGVRRYQNKDGTLTSEGKKRKSISERAEEAMDKVMGLDNKAVNTFLKTSGNLRIEYSKLGKAKTEREQRSAAKRASKFAKAYLEEYGKKPLNYIQYNNAKKGATIGAIAGIAVPVILPLWATIPAGYYIGSKISHSDIDDIDFKDHLELYHYGVKGMKWHKHLFKFRDDDDGDDKGSILDGSRFESDEFKTKQKVLEDAYAQGDYKRLAQYYVHNKEAKAMIDAVAQPAIVDFLDKNIGAGAGNKYKSFRKDLKKLVKSNQKKSRGRYEDDEPIRLIGRYEDYHPEEKKKKGGKKK